jgi:hypothetical protein
VKSSTRVEAGPFLDVAIEPCRPVLTRRKANRQAFGLHFVQRSL